MNRRFGIAAILILAILAGGFAYTQFLKPSPTASTETTRAVEVTLAIENILPPHRAKIADGTTALELLRMESAEEGFTMSEKEYAGLGTLVESIGDFRNGTEGKYWTYTVNGAFSAVGADVYQPKAGDLIEWSFAEPEDIN